MQFRNIGVVGAGMMGGEIAAVCAMKGHPTRIVDASSEQAEAAIERLASVLQKGAARNLWSEEAAAMAMANLTPAAGMADLAECNLVIEAVFEDVDIKRAIFTDLDGILPRDAIIASNTSSIPITSLASAVSDDRRARFLGTHFFSPVTRMKLVELIPALDTDPALIDAVKDFLADLGKVPITVKDIPGFAVNRLLHAMVIEAIRLVEEGVITPEDVDLGCKHGLGHPIGPFELLDGTRNSLSLAIQEILLEAYGERFRPPAMLKQLVAAGYDGRKSGRGWYRYDDKGERLK